MKTRLEKVESILSTHLRDPKAPQAVSDALLDLAQAIDALRVEIEKADAELARYAHETAKAAPRSRHAPPPNASP